MEMPMFHPSDQVASDDQVGRLLKTAAQYVFVLTCGLSPLLFLPMLFIAPSYSKFLIIMFGAAVALLLYCLSILREGRWSFAMPLGMLAFLAVTLATVVSAFFSGDLRDSFFGDTIGISTAAFVILMFVLMALGSILSSSKAMIMRLYVLLSLCALLLVVFHVARLLLGADKLTAGIFYGNTDSPLGGWNSLAIFFGLVVLLLLVALEHLPLTRIGQVITGVVVLSSLAMLAVVNFFHVWLVLGFVSFIVLVYALVKHRFLGPQLSLGVEATNTLVSILVALLVLVTSAVFVVSGDKLGLMVSEKTGVSFVEVRPSFEGTLDIAKSVLSKSPVFGIGPNRFADAWRLYKQPEINETIFWSNDFVSGSSYVLTAIVETGIIGLVAYLAFFILLLICGMRVLFRSGSADSFWYFIALSSFTASLYLWGVNLLYVPALSILLLSAVTTGIFFTAYGQVVPVRYYTLSIEQNRSVGFVLIVLVMMVIVGSSGYVYLATGQFIATRDFNRAMTSVSPGDTLEALEQKIADAYLLHQTDVFPRQIAAYQLAQLNSLISLETPSDIERQAFGNAAKKGLEAVGLSLKLDETEPINWRIAGSIYSILSFAGITDAKERAVEAFTRARELDPNNPTIYFLEAQLASRSGDLGLSREKAETAIRLRPRYTEALYFLVQIDVVEGKVNEAIERTRSIIQLEPQNPARRYQLGALYSAAGNVDAAVVAFEEAVTLEPRYANAHYLLALGYVAQNRIQEAIAELRVVRDLNPGNTAVDSIILQLEKGEVPNSLQANTLPVSEPSESFGDSPINEADISSDLITSVNTIPDTTAPKTPGTASGTEPNVE